RRVGVTRFADPWAGGAGVAPLPRRGSPAASRGRSFAPPAGAGSTAAARLGPARPHVLCRRQGGLEPIGVAQHLDRMRGRDAEILGHVESRQRAIGDETGRLRVLECTRELLAVLPRQLVVLALHPPRAVERRAALDRLDSRAGDERQDRRERRADVLRAQMTWHVVSELPLRPNEIGAKPTGGAL